jgi:2-polyprenyl-6-methoxyphenol hydroxylase-like FAD-dependent oxidoreductase
MMTHETSQVEVINTTCCVVGGGPAGVFASLLLARRGVPVVLLESHKDFDRDFRGDTVHPSTLEVLDQIGLAEKVLAIPHGKLTTFRIGSVGKARVVADFRRLKTKFPFIATLPQAKMLDVLAADANKLTSFTKIMGANVNKLVIENGTIVGVRFQGSDGVTHEVRASLTIAADGRFSKIRSLVGLEPIRTSPPMDVIWFRLPKSSSDASDQGEVSIGDGHLVVFLDRGDEWQLGLCVLKGSFGEIKKGGVEAIRAIVSKLVPWLGDRVNALTDWSAFTVLSVESSRLACWHKPGLLLIGDAAHAMSPVGGVGINYAIQDAVEAVNFLAKPLKDGSLTEGALARVQAVRERPVKVIQAVQRQMQERIIRQGLQSGRPFEMPWLLKVITSLPVLKDLPAKMLAYGIRKVKVEEQD